MRSYIIFINLILIIALAEVIYCQKGVMDGRIRQRICNSRNSTMNLSGTLGTCASALAQEIQTVLTTCLSKQNKKVTPDDILSVMCADASFKQFNDCYSAEAAKMSKTSIPKSGSMNAFRECLRNAMKKPKA